MHVHVQNDGKMVLVGTCIIAACEGPCMLVCE